MKKPPQLNVDFLVNKNESNDQSDQSKDKPEEEKQDGSPNTEKKSTLGVMLNQDEKSKIKKQSKTNKKPNLMYNLQYDVEVYTKEKKDKSLGNEQEYNQGKWTEEEHQNFLRGFQALGRRWTKISKHFVKSRTPIQVTSYAQKYCRDNNIEFK